MKPGDSLRSACEACAAACETALLAARKDAAAALMRVKPHQDRLKEIGAELIRHKRIIRIFGFIPGVGKTLRTRAIAAAEGYSHLKLTLENLKTEVSRHTRDAGSSENIRNAFLNIMRNLPSETVTGQFRGIAVRADTIRAKAVFLMNNDLHLKSRRRKALESMSGLLNDLGILQEEIRNPPAAASDTVVSGVLPLPMRSLKKAVGTPRKQIAMDFSGRGEHAEVSRIWLPVPHSRVREMVSMGARFDPEAPKRGSKVWVPVDEAEKFEAVLPLAFRSEPVHFSYPPIRHGAVGQNLGKVFDRESWSRIRNDAYDRAGHRCQICGKQHGTMWSRITPGEDRKTSGPVDCHEVWEWTPAGNNRGIQKLKRLLVLCKDCHLSFHEGFAMHRARESGMETEVRTHLEKIRMLTNHMSIDEVRAGMLADKREWESNRDVSTWILDLSHIAAQGIMQDHTLVLDPDNKAGMTPDMIGGTEFLSGGLLFEATPAESLASGMAARLSASARSRLI